MSTSQDITRELSTTKAPVHGDPARVPNDAEAMRPAHPPVGSGASPLFAQLIALALIALGAVGIQEAVVRSGATTATSWVSSVLDAVDNRTAPAWLVVPGVALIVLGLLLLPVVLRRRRRKSLSLKSSTGLYLKTGDLARVVSAALDGLDGATDTHVKASRRRLDVDVTTIAAEDANPDLEQAVHARVEKTLDALENPPRVKVKIKNEELA